MSQPLYQDSLERPSTHPLENPPSSRLSKGLIWIMAIGAGASVANLYYNQPLLVEMAQTFQVSASRIGNISMLTQIGYALGMFFFIPLGDLRERRKLITNLLGAVILALLAMAFAPDITMLELASFAVGATTIVPQLIVPFAAQLAKPQEQGRVVGLVMSGLFFGILLARLVSGMIGHFLGWRMMYLIAAGFMFILMLLLRTYLPKCEPENSRIPYPQVMRSLGQLVIKQPVLRKTSFMGGMLFGAFSLFWTTLVFFLEQPPYAYGSEVAGLFGLVGVVGASMAPLAGRLADKNSPRSVAGVAAGIALLSFVILGLLGKQLWGLILGVILLDLGVQSAQIANQTQIYTLIPNARNRLNTVYMVTYFGGGALGSTLGVYLWSVRGWQGVCWGGLSMVLLSLIAWGLNFREHGPKN
ncbi:MFS transporter [Desulfitobacterium sp.]|uniref:MFS transporter n=1 Tax=Desulfitobacterium sp. TaxID=49981 RepID=UPI002CEEB85D|nr:MFS transporter [Desulfitobacterium sp.]HVJ48501.1 MFS transporter [Desulfitobacterium sp.]